jgi:hypothetical protein
MRFFPSRHIFLVLAAAALLASPLLAQDTAPEKDEGISLKDLKKTRKEAPAESKELNTEQRKERLKSFKKEVSKTYQNWLDQDVRYIITPEEEQAFKLLGTDEERDQFIEQFWLRRDPTPDTAKSIIAASSTPMNISPPASPAGELIVGASTSSGVQPMKLSPIPPAETISATRVKAAVPLLHSRSSAGVIAILKASAMRSSLSS